VAFFRERLSRSPILVIEGESWDALAHADLALAASGTVTVEAALLGTPMVTFYKVTAPSWVVGKLMVRVPFFCMVNLIAGRRVVPELMQGQMTGEALAREARRLLTDERARAEMKAALAEVREKLSQGPGQEAIPAPRRAAALIQEILEGQVVHVS
jgi:lipid-A-disaccharide synthase